MGGPDAVVPDTATFGLKVMCSLQSYGKDFLNSSHNAHARTRFFPASSSNRNLCVQSAFTRERFQGNDSITDRIME